MLLYLSLVQPHSLSSSVEANSLDYAPGCYRSAELLSPTHVLSMVVIIFLAHTPYCHWLAIAV
jgi:hypothetical protein